MRSRHHTERRRLLHAVTVIGLLALAAGAPTRAQIATDDTLGPARDLIGPDYQIDDDFGQRVGENLFFSFDEFNLPSGSSATWTGPATIEHIINRVTGGAPSTIDGTLRVSGMPSADFWFINPAGVTFGANASLDVPASVYISTASALRLGGSGVFSTSQPGVSLLTAEAPSGFAFDGPLVGAITVNGALLEVDRGEQIALVGGDVVVDEGRLVAPGGRVQIASVGSAGEVLLDPEGTLVLEGFDELGTVLLRRSEDQVLDLQGNLDVSSPIGTDLTSGRIDVLGGHLVSESGGITAVNRGGTQGGEVRLVLEESVALLGDTDVRTEALRAGDGGNIIVQTQHFVAAGQTQVSSDALSAGNGGDVLIDAETILLEDTAAISSNTSGSGNGGNIHLAASADLRMNDISTIRVRTDRDGDAGNITLEGENVRLTGSATLQASTFLRSTGDGGQIRIEARDTFEFVGSGQGALGDSALISTRAAGSGNAGDVEIIASRAVIGGLALIESSTNAEGRAGAIDIAANELVLEGGAAIDSRSTGAGQGGAVRVTAGELLLRQGARLSAEAFGSGNAGDIAVDTTGDLLMADARIATAATTADGGNITLAVGGDLLLDAATIETSVQSGVGNGGNIALTGPELVVLRDSRVEANAFGGNGGNIDATAEFLVFSATSTVRASSELGIDGQIRFSTPEVDLAALAELSAPTQLDPDRIRLARCAAVGAKSRSRLILESPGAEQQPGRPCE